MYLHPTTTDTKSTANLKDSLRHTLRELAATHICILENTYTPPQTRTVGEQERVLTILKTHFKHVAGNAIDLSQSLNAPQEVELAISPALFALKSIRYEQDVYKWIAELGLVELN